MESTHFAITIMIENRGTTSYSLSHQLLLDEDSTCLAQFENLRYTNVFSSGGYVRIYFHLLIFFVCLFVRLPGKKV